MSARRLNTAAVLLLAGALGAFAQDAGWVDENDLVDAILERRAFDAQELAQLDLNGDGGVDVADLICFHFECHREAFFESSASRVDEGVGTANVTVRFELPFTGTLLYKIRPETGDAPAWADIPAFGIGVDGTSVDIPVAVVDDTAIEPPETIVLRLVEDPAYGLGVTTEHRLTVDENDARWHGTIFSRGGAVQFRVDLVRGPGGYEATFVGDGFSTLPDGVFPATVAFVPETSFAATVGGIVMEAASTGLGVPITRTIELNPPDLIGSPDDVSTSSTLIFGRFRERLDVAGRPLLSREITGSFSLAREETAPGTEDAP